MPKTSDDPALGKTIQIGLENAPDGLIVRKVVYDFEQFTITQIDSFVRHQAGTGGKKDPQFVYFVAVLDQTNGKKYEVHMIDTVSGVVEAKQLVSTTTGGTLLYIKPIINQTLQPDKKFSQILLQSVHRPAESQDKPILISDIDLVSSDQKLCYKVGLLKSSSKSLFMVRQNTKPGTTEFEFFLMALDLPKMYYSRNTCNQDWKTEAKQTVTSLDFSEYSSFSFLAANFDCSYRDRNNTHIVVMLADNSGMYRFLIVRASTRFFESSKHKTDLDFESMLNTKIPIPFSAETEAKYDRNTKFTEVFVSTGMKFIAVGGIFPRLVPRSDLNSKQSDILILFLNVCNGKEGPTEPLSNRRVELFLPDDSGDQISEKINNTDFGKFNSWIEIRLELEASQKELQLQMAHVELLYDKYFFLVTLYGVTQTLELGYILAFKEPASHSSPTLRVRSFNLKEQLEKKIEIQGVPKNGLAAIDKSLKIVETDGKVNLVFAVAFYPNKLFEFEIDISSSLEKTLKIEKTESKRGEGKNERL
jgi:hypothetical protein